jgi:AraC-like DNA-binding protein/mannose-6-phosphate isomerase-like protein (cupin superfamily)
MMPLPRGVFALESNLRNEDVRTEGSAVSEARFFEARLRRLAAPRAADRYIHITSRPSERQHPGQQSFYQHVAETHEVAFVTQGKARIVTSDGFVDLTPGRLAVIDRGVEHGESPTDPPCPYVMFWCGTNHQSVRLDQTGYTPPSLYQAGPTLVLDGRTNVENIIAAVASELAAREWGWLQNVQHLLSYLSCLLIRRIRRGNVLHLRPSESPTISADPRVWQILQGALQFCDANFRQAVHLGDVAAAVGYSPTYLSRLFSSHLGRSISEHLLDLRMTAAKQALRNSDLSIAEIAASVGYSDHSHFSRAFANNIGASPKNYRRTTT